jgi:hypothetical protein
MGEMDDLDGKIYKELATQYSYNPDSAKQICQFVKYLHHFAQYVGAHKYYSDTLNKRVALLALDADLLALQAEKAKLESEQVYSKMELATLTKKPPAGLAKIIEDLKANLQSINGQALAQHVATTKLMKDIKAEYSDSGPAYSTQSQ